MSSSSSSAANSQEAHFLTREAGLFDHYYRDLQAASGRRVPRRKEIDLRDAKAFLAYVTILEPVDIDTVIIRLAGTAIRNRVGKNTTGVNVLEYLPPELRQEAWKAYQRILTTPCASKYLHHERYDGRIISAENTLYPFADEMDEARFLIGVCVEVDRQSLLWRGSEAGEIGAFSKMTFIEI